MTELTVEYVAIGEIQPYENNPRLNAGSIDKVAASIRDFGWRQPIVVDKDMTIIAGHTRYEAAKHLGMDKVPVVIAKDMTPQQAKAYRLADNKAGESSEWDFEALDRELDAILDFDMSEYGFGGIDFGNLEDMMEDEIDPEHQEFLDKFKEKHTTDDCFTPPAVYDAIAGWVKDRYGHKGKIVRPFYPGGDYKAHRYPDGCLVLDNPPFSILKEIATFYLERNIDFFLFADARVMGWYFDLCNIVLGGVNITYENGADVRTGFITNLGQDKAIVSASLHDAIENAQPKETANLNAYSYPDNLMTSMGLDRLASYGSEFGIRNLKAVKKLDCGQEIFGGGALVSDTEAERVKAERVKAERVKAERVKIPIELSERERGVVESLNRLDGLI